MRVYRAFIFLYVAFGLSLMECDGRNSHPAEMKRIPYVPFRAGLSDLAGDDFSIHVTAPNGQPVVSLFPSGNVGFFSLSECNAVAKGYWRIEGGQLRVRATIFDYVGCKPHIWAEQVDLLFSEVECEGANRACNAEMRTTDGRIFFGAWGPYY